MKNFKTVVNVMKTIQFFNKKGWGILFAQVLSLVLVISLALPTFAANAVAVGLDGIWMTDDYPSGPIILELFDGNDTGYMYCNQYFGDYATVKAEENCGAQLPISFARQASTKVGCQENDFETEYLQSLETTEIYEICDDVLTLSGSYNTLKFFRQ